MPIPLYKRRGPAQRNGLLRALLASALLTGVFLPGCEAGPEEAHLAAHAAGMTLVGYSDLGGEGLNGPVATVGQTAVVAAGILPGAGLHTHFYNPYPCPAVAVKVVDLSEPAAPRVAATIPMPEGVAASDVAALRVETASFRGDLAAISLVRCNATGNNANRGVLYYDISDPAAPAFLGRYYADVDSVGVGPACGEHESAECASSQYAVHLVQRDDGRLLSLSTEPGASASNYDAGDVRIVDVTDPSRPTLVGSYPGPGMPIFSTNGCRPFSGGYGASATADGRTGLVALFDGGLATLDLSDPAAPVEQGRLGYEATREVEGNAARVAVAEVGGRRLALVSEADWIGPESRVRVDAPEAVAGSYFACPAMFTLFAPGDSVQVYHRPEATLAAEIVYVGRGCPANADWGTEAPDPYLGDARGKIALIDRMRQDTQPDLNAGSGCSLVERLKRAQAEGAVGAVMSQTNANAPEAFSPDGDIDYVTLPLVMIDKDGGDRLRVAACPALEEGRCTGGVPLQGALVDAPGAWGGLRIIDITDPYAPAEITTHRTPGAEAFPLPDLGVYAPGPVATHGGHAYVAWHSEGLRVLDLAIEPVAEVGVFTPNDAPDPTGTLPAKAYVVGVGLLDDASGGTPLVIITDLHSGLYVLAPQLP